MPAKAGQHYCTQCSRTFARSEHLVRHRRTHTKEKPFQCHRCSQSFARSDLLRRHHSKHHHASPGAGHGTLDIPGAQGAPPDTPQIDEFTEGAMSLSQSREGSHALQPDRAPTQPGPAPAIDSIPFDAFDQWPDQEMGELDVNNTLDAFPFESWASDIPDWILNFSPSGFEHDPNLPAQEDQPSTPLGSSTEGRQSLLSRPSTPPRKDSAGSSAARASALPVQHRAFVLSPECHARLQTEISHVAPGCLPSGSVMSRYIRRFFRSFNRHQPLLHEPTWDHEAATPSLIFAICANGAVYDLEHAVARRLHEAAVHALKSTVSGLHTLQAYMLCIAFAAWQGTCESALLAAKLNAAMLPEMRRQWASRSPTSTSMLQDWRHWIEDESLKRVTCCLFTLNTLMGLAYDHAPAITLGADIELPAHEEQWAASTPAEWYRSNAAFCAQPRPSFGTLEAVLADQAIPLPAHVGIFGCHVLMTKILNRIILLRRSVTTSDGIFRSRQADLMLRLKRWQHMWEAEPQASLSPDNPQGPITFNATAILRVAYVRLAADFSTVRGSFTFCKNAHQIEPFVSAMPLPIRDEYSTRAALQAALALRIPVKLGIKLISRTSFWVWSIQHALCYFECAIFLSKWLEAIQGAADLDSSESTVVKVVQGILQDVQGERQWAVDAPSYPELLQSWSTLLNTGDTTVWYLIPKMAKVLELYARSKMHMTDPALS